MSVPETVVVELIIAAKHDEGATARTQGIEDLESCIEPYLQYIYIKLSRDPNRWNFTGHELLTPKRNSCCMVRNEPFLYRLKRGRIPRSVILHLPEQSIVL